MSISDSIIGGRLTHGVVWNDLQGEPRANTGPGSPSWSTFQSNLKSWKMAVGDGFQISFQQSHGWDLTTIRPHVHFSIGTSGTGTKVKWQIEYTYQKTDGTWLTPNVTDSVEIAVSTGAVMKYYFGSWAEITPTTPHTRSMCSKFLITRIASSDEFTGDVFLDYIDIHEPRIKLGTATELA